ncbi:MAG: tRNA pseudouridine(38-40) synthase TruA [Clostridia bacterium]|nr:tRNA pseudouridine(38-40) synthase TruA [Clostridia bacterium]
MNRKLTIAYDGTAYCGWQFQKNGISVQEVLQNALSICEGECVSVIGCSRTDAGVHAEMHVSNYRAAGRIPAPKLPFALNTLLPSDIRALKCEDAPEDFNARFDARFKLYEYKIWNAPHANPLLCRYAWHYPIETDFAAMCAAADLIRGERDFRAFCAAGSKVKTTVRNLSVLSLKKSGSLITVKAGANGFLYNMVRIIVGTLIYAGNGKLNAGDIAAILQKGVRSGGGITAPACGLTLKEVIYGEDDEYAKREAE